MRIFHACILSGTCLAASAAAPGCSTLPASGSAAQVTELAALDYPATAAYGDDLPVIITRENRDIRLNNTGTQAKRDCVLWVNRQYAFQLPFLGVGADNVVDLTACINRHQEPFPVGYWLRPDMDKRVVLVEVYDPAKKTRHRLIARPPQDPFSEK